MSAATQTGAEFRARRERLGLSREWARDSVQWPRPEGSYFVATIESGSWDTVVAGSTAADAIRAYAAALTAEEQRRAAEEQRRAAAPLTEPVAPEGVVVRSNNAVESHGTIVSQRGATDFAVVWDDGGSPRIFGANEVSAEALEYVAALSRYRAAQHAAGEQQRKLDAVRAADDAYQAADRAYLESCTESTRFWNVRQEALIALNAAKREAGL